MAKPPPKTTEQASTARVRSYREKLRASGRQRLEISLPEPVYGALQSLAEREGSSVTAVVEALVTGYALPAVARELPPRSETRAKVQEALKPVRANPMAEFLAKRTLSQRPPSTSNPKEK